MESTETAIRALSANVVNARFDNFDKSNVNDVKNRLIDIIGCAVGGYDASGNKSLLELMNEWGSLGQATVWISNSKTAPQNAAMINSIMARSYDFEVMAGVLEDKVFAAHHAASIIPTAIALGEINKINGKELMTSILVADDLAARILVAAGGSPIHMGWDGTMLYSSWGTTAVTGSW